MEEYLQKIRIPIRLSIQLPSGHPFVLSLWFEYKSGTGKIYCATSASAKLVQYLRQNHLVGFEIAADTAPYCGIRGYGIAEIHPDENFQQIKRLYQRYFKDTESKLYQFLIDTSREEVQIIITPEKIVSWNFSARMADSAPKPIEKLCL